MTRLTLLALALSATTTAAAQGGSGYLFHAPQARLSLRGGYAVATANSDLFQDVTSRLTLNKGDFSGLTLGAELSLPVTNRFQLGGDVGYSRTSKGSEFRNLVDNNDQPIEQNTSFERVPVMVTARYYLTSPGRSIGSLAYIPAKTTTWVGVGGGAMYYRFAQNGDFVDYQNNHVFSGQFKTDNWAPAAQVMGGVDFSLTPLLALTTEARYITAHGSLTSDFSGYNKLDLSGATATVGLTFRL